MQTLFQVAAKVTSFYVVLCIIRIFLTWIPSVEYSMVGRFFSTLCDPYLNLFRRIPLRIGMIDFSPMISIGLLSLLSSILSNIAQTGHIYIGAILASLVILIWNILSWLIMLFIIVLVIRLIAMAFTRRGNYYNSIWSSLDNSLSPLLFKITRIFSFGKTLKYKGALIVALIEMVLLFVFGRLLFAIIVQLFMKLPF